jgi:hypothetical protein
MKDVTWKTDLRHKFGPIRDQGTRPTCLAFAASDVHAALRGPWEPLSCEYAFYKCQFRSGAPHSKGALLSQMLETLRVDGQPKEEGWPYLAAVPSDVTLWAPPVPADPLFRRGGEQKPTAINEVITMLDSGLPAILLLYLSSSFYYARPDGIVDLAAGEVPIFQRRHAVVAVAHGIRNGGRVILIRNSWGDGWAAEGSAVLSEPWLTPRLYGVAALKEDLSVPSHSAAA